MRGRSRASRFGELLIVPALAAEIGVAIWMTRHLPPTDTIADGGAAILALFIPILCAIAALMKHDKSNRREHAVFNTDHLRETQYYQLYERNRTPSIIRQAWFPILVISLINVYFSYILIFTPQLDGKHFANFLLLGHRFMSCGAADPACDAANDAYLRQSLNTMCYAYLGWYIWTVSTIFSRLITMELVAATYYSLLVRLTVAVFVSLVFTHIQSIIFTGTSVFVAEAVGFGVGLFPDAALAFLTRLLRKYLLSGDDSSPELSLDMIQGISAFRKLRLYEMGLDNCENLASANAVELFLASNLKLVEVIDWIGQAQLAIMLGKVKFALLQSNGYRNVIDLHRGSHGGAAQVVADLLQMPLSQLVDLAQGLDQDPSYHNLIELRAHLLEPLALHTRALNALPQQG